MGNQDKAEYGNQENKGNAQGGDNVADNPFQDSKIKSGEISIERQIRGDDCDTGYGRHSCQ